MKPENLRKIAGVAAMLVGIGWVWNFGELSSDMSVVMNDPLLAVFEVCFTGLMMAPGMVLIIFGWRLFRSFSRTALTQIVGAIAVVGALLAVAALDSLLAGSFPGARNHFGVWFAVTLVAIPAYRAVVWFLQPRLGGERPGPYRGYSRGGLILLAWLLGFALVEAFQQIPPPEVIREIPSSKLIWPTVQQFGPICLAYGSYALACRLLLPRSEKGRQFSLPKEIRPETPASPGVSE